MECWNSRWTNIFANACLDLRERNVLTRSFTQFLQAAGRIRDGSMQAKAAMHLYLHLHLRGCEGQPLAVATTTRQARVDTRLALLELESQESGAELHGWHCDCDVVISARTEHSTDDNDARDASTRPCVQ